MRLRNYCCVLPWTLLSCFYCAFSTAAETPPPVSWICWHGTQTDFSIHCVREIDPVLDVSDDEASEPFNNARMLSSFFAAGKPRNISRVIREAPAPYRDVIWTIPLYSMPFDMNEVALLARSIMCGTDANCELSIDREQPVLARR